MLHTPSARGARRGAALAVCTLLLAACGQPTGPQPQPAAPAAPELSLGEFTPVSSSVALAAPGDPSRDLAVMESDGAEVAFAPPEQMTSVARGPRWTKEAVARVLGDAEAEHTNVLVRLPDGVSPDRLAALPDVTVEPLGFGTRVYEVTLPRGRDLGPYAEHLVSAGDAVGVNSRVRLLETTPNDPLFAQQWELGAASPGGIRAAQGWDKGVDGSGVIVAVTDTGVERSLSELAANTIEGYDAIANRAGSGDPNGHGTSCAGLIGAVSNNASGVAGVCWRARIMPVRVLAADGSGTISSIVRGVLFAVQNGAKVINMSLGGPGASQFMFDALNEARRAGVLIVAAAGNEGNNADVAPSYPAAYPLDNIISVAAVDQQGRLASFSNFGVQSVDLAAPGQSVIVLQPNRTAIRSSGTSFSSPIVAGAATLLWSQNPGLTYAQVRAQVLRGVDPLASLAGRVATGGRLNLAKVLSLGTPAPAPTPTPAQPMTVEAESAQVTRTGTWQSSARDFHSGGQALASSTAGSTLQASVTGARVSILVSPGPNRGVGRVFLDGRLLGTLDLYAPTTAGQVEVSLGTNLAPGSHVVRVEALGVRRSASSGAFFVMDAFRGAP